MERWYYAHRAGGREALRPAPRSDRGRAHELTEPQRELLLDVRREHPAATASVILREMIASGRIDAGAVSEATVRRLRDAIVEALAARELVMLVGEPGVGKTSRTRARERSTRC